MLKGGMTPGEAAIFAEQSVANQGFYKLIGKIKVMNTPEAALVVIVESFWKSMISQMEADHRLADRALGPDHPSRRAMLVKAIDAIETHRSRFCSGPKNYPYGLFEYVQHRIPLEIRHMKYDPVQMGLDDEALTEMTAQAYDYFKARVNELRT
jgi:hypothetical protein